MKSRPIKSPELLREFALEHWRCACCWRKSGYTIATRLETHHLVKPGRSDERCNLLRLCNRCHRLAEGERIRGADGELLPTLRLEHCLWLKRESDRRHWRPSRLAVLRRRALPQRVEPAAELLAERAGHA